MTKTIAVNEYYDCFNIKTNSSGVVSESTTSLPNQIENQNRYNVFRGFSNWEDFSANNSSSNIMITGQFKSPQATQQLQIDDDGSIWCYPPNVSVPYWSEIVFRNFDYNYKNNKAVRDMIGFLGDVSFTKLVQPPLDNNLTPIPEAISVTYTADDQLVSSDWVAGETEIDQLWGKDTATYKKSGQYPKNFPAVYQQDFTNLEGFYDDVELIDFKTAPLFLKFDEYQSRSKVIFSNCDKTRNPDIRFRFGYKKSQMEPIKLTLSLSANQPLLDGSDKYNHNLTKEDINKLLNSCYWCIEWISAQEA